MNITYSNDEVNILDKIQDYGSKLNELKHLEEANKTLRQKLDEQKLELEKMQKKMEQLEQESDEKNQAIISFLWNLIGQQVIVIMREAGTGSESAANSGGAGSSKGDTGSVAEAMNDGGEMPDGQPKTVAVKVRAKLLLEMMRRCGWGLDTKDATKVSRLAALILSSSGQKLYQLVQQDFQLNSKFHSADVDTVNRLLEELGVDFRLKI